MAALSHIRAQGGDVIRDGYRFTLRRGRLSQHAITWIKDNLSAVKREVWADFDRWEERAAIMEFDGGLSREEAELAAYQSLGGEHARAA
jgi:hypothetical protein